MTALERAKRFIQKSAARTALVIVPLAVASAADASSITFNAGTATPTAAPAGSPGITPIPGGVGSFSSLPNGGILFSGEYAFTVVPPPSGSGFIQLELSGTGNSGPLDMATLPAAFDYALTFTNESGVLTALPSLFGSSIEFFMNGFTATKNGPGPGDFGPISSLPIAGSISASGSPVLEGWQSLPLVPDPLDMWSVLLKAQFVCSSGLAGCGFDEPGTLTLTVNEVSIRPAAIATDAAVPEPSSLLLFSTGAAFVVRVRRRRQPS